MHLPDPARWYFRQKSEGRAPFTWAVVALVVALLALAYCASPAAGQVREISFIRLPSDGSAFMGNEAIPTPGFVDIRGATLADREYVGSQAVTVRSDGIAVEAELVVAGTAPPVKLVGVPVGSEPHIHLRWTDITAELFLDGALAAADFLLQAPSPNMGDLTAGAGGGDYVELTRWRVGAINVFADDFESGDLAAWVVCPPDCDDAR